MDKEKLRRLAETDLSHVIASENNVKYKIVIPFLQSFNHVEFDLEHAAQGSRIDINIGNRIIVETKALGVNLNNHVQQLSDYSGKEFPILAILTNGRHFRIYSPQWRFQKSFAEKIIYEFYLSDLKNIELINRLERILCFTNYNNEEFIVHIEQREKEIIESKKIIEEFHQLRSVQLKELDAEITDLKEQVQKIKREIESKEEIVIAISTTLIPEVNDINKEIWLPLENATSSASSLSSRNKRVNDLGTMLPFASDDINCNRTEEQEIARVKTRVPKWFNSPNQANHKILIKYLELLGDKESISLAEFRKTCFNIDNFLNHYSGMKAIRERNHGKVFEEINKEVFLWEPVKNFIEAEYNRFQNPGVK